MTTEFSSPSAGSLRKSEKARISKSEYYKSIFKSIFKPILKVLALLFLVYFCFAALIIRFVPTSSDLGVILVKAPTYHDGILPVGSSALISVEKPYDDSILTNLKTAVTINSNVAVVEIQGGPIAELKWSSDGQVAVDGRIIDHEATGKPLNRDFLSNEYLGVCSGGDCVPGEIIIFPKEYIMGVPIDIKEK